jgi:hypothetical protein
MLAAAGLALRITLLGLPLAPTFLPHGDDATSHVLATVDAMRRLPPEIHHFLPVFTMPGPGSQGIDDLPGASVADGHGYFFYTSWPPGLFLFPYAVSEMTGIAPSPAFLRGVNLLLHCAAAALLALLCRDVARKAGGSAASSAAAAAIGLSLGATGWEEMCSHLFAYWGTTLYAPLLVLQMLLFLRGGTGPAFLAVSAAGCLCDWTAFVTAAGFALAQTLWPGGLSRRAALSRSAAILASAAAALACIGVWWASKLPLHDVLAAMGRRADVRSGTWLTLLWLPWFWLQALRAHAMVAAVAAACLLLAAGKPSGRSFARMAIFVAAFPLLENILLSQHATVYPYDTLKAVNLVAVAAALAVARMPRLAPAMVIMSLAGSAEALVLFTQSAWDVPALREEGEVLGGLIRSDTPEGYVAATNIGWVRGALVYYAKRNVLQGFPSSGDAQAIGWRARDAARLLGAPGAVVFVVHHEGRTVDVVTVAVGSPDPPSVVSHSIAVPVQ